MSSPITIAVVGGGQLGRMLASEARSMGFRILALDPSDPAPASGLVHGLHKGPLDDYDQTLALAKDADVVTVEIEHVSIAALKAIEAQGKPVYPQPRVLEIVGDKLVQKRFFQDRGLPVPVFSSLPVEEVLRYRPDHYPLVQKARRGGYDGRGVHILRSHRDLAGLLKTDSMIEEFIADAREVSVLVARNPQGDICNYPVTEMVFHPQLNLCDSTLAPARISAGIEKHSVEVAVGCAEALDVVGLLAVELFITDWGEVLINEVAPRPHNSGHWTMDGAVTSQFQQHLRAITSMPLGSTRAFGPTAMVNLLGTGDGPALLRGHGEALARGDLSIHWYEKSESRVGRKMGHVNVVHPDPETALAQGREGVKYIYTSAQVGEDGHG